MDHLTGGLVPHDRISDAVVSKRLGALRSHLLFPKLTPLKHSGPATLAGYLRGPFAKCPRSRPQRERDIRGLILSVGAPWAILPIESLVARRFGLRPLGLAHKRF